MIKILHVFNAVNTERQAMVGTPLSKPIILITFKTSGERSYSLLKIKFIIST